MVCPQCGSPQNFLVKHRHVVVGDPGAEFVEHYVQCAACPYWLTLRRGPREVVELEEEIDRLRGRVEAGERTLESVLRAREGKLARLREAHEGRYG